MEKTSTNKLIPQIRSFDVTVGQKSEEFRVEGYACTFDKAYPVSKLKNGTLIYEVIDRSAFNGADMSDVIMRYNHRDKILARTSNGSLSLLVDSHGLKFLADLSQSAAAREMYEEVKNGLITKMSFAFISHEEYERFDRSTYTNRIMRFKKIVDISTVASPANEDAEIEARSKFEGYFGKIEPLELLKLKAKLF
jgi:hypothetical protein